MTGNEKRKGDETASLASVTAAREEEKKKLSRKLSDYRADQRYLNYLFERGKYSRGNLAETFGHPTINSGPS